MMEKLRQLQKKQTSEIKIEPEMAQSSNKTI